MLVKKAHAEKDADIKMQLCNNAKKYAVTDYIKKEIIAITGEPYFDEPEANYESDDSSDYDADYDSDDDEEEQEEVEEDYSDDEDEEDEQPDEDWDY